MEGTSPTSKRRTRLALLLAGVLVVSSVGPALAAPRVYVASASLEDRAVVAGTPVDVNFQLRNTGDSGARQVQITANGSVKYSERYQVDSGEVRNLNAQLTFDDPGRYQIQVGTKQAGTVEVRQTLVETTEVRSDGRTMVLRGGRIAYDSRVTSEFPTTNDTVAVESLTYQTLRNEFDRTIETYSNTTTAPISVSSGDRTTVYGAVTVDSERGIDDHSVQIGVNQSVIDDSSLTNDEVHLYRGNDGEYVQLNTTIVGVEDGRYVFEATTNDTGTLLVGSITPSFSVGGHSLSTSENENEKRVIVSANVSNTGSVAGNYTASMLIDDSAVGNQTVTLAPGENREVVLSERISRDGSYRVALDQQFVGAVVVATGDSGEDSPTETDAAGEPQTSTEADSGSSATATNTAQRGDGTTERSGATDTATQSSGGGDDAGDGSIGDDFSLPNPDVGLTEIAIGGGVAVIGVILVLLQRW